MEVPKFPEVWTADFPFTGGVEKGEKLRAVLILGYNKTENTVAAVKITTTRPRTMFAGQFGLSRADGEVFVKSGLRFDSKVDFQSVAEIPLSNVKKRIGFLDVDHPSVSYRLITAIKASRYADAIRLIGRTFV